MDCLVGIVGLVGCGTSNPASGLFINSLPGMSLKSLSSLANEEQSTASGLWDDIQLRAAKRMQIDVINAFAKRYKLSSLTYSINLGRDVDATSTTASAAQQRGVSFDLDAGLSEDSDYKTSGLQSHYIQTISFYATGNANGIAFTIYDKDLGTILYTTSQDITSGWNTIQVNRLFTARRIVVVVNSAAITTATLNVPSNLQTGGHCTAKVTGGYFVTASGISSWVEGDNTHGVSVVYSVRCKYESIVCANIELFSLPYWYLCGSELMAERISSDRINKWTVDREQAKELKAHYDSMYETSLKSVVDGIAIDENDCCVDCGGEVKSVEWNPYV